MATEINELLALNARLSTPKQEKEWRELTEKDGLDPREIGSLHAHRQWDAWAFENSIDNITEAQRKAMVDQTKLSAKEDSNLRENVGEAMEALGKVIDDLKTKVDNPLLVLLSALINVTDDIADEVLELR